MRTTLNIDDPVLAELKVLQREQGKSLGRLVSELLARALAERRSRVEDGGVAFGWHARSLGARVDLDDPEALAEALADGAGAAAE